MAYRSTLHSSTGVAPFTLMLSREMQTKIPMLDLEPYPTVHEQAADRDAVVKCKNKT